MPLLPIAILAFLILAGYGFYQVKVSNNTNDLANSLKSLPSRLSRWNNELASAALKTVPKDLTSTYWASLLAGIMDAESRGGDALNTGGPDGVGDFSNRWRLGPPSWAQSLGLLTSQQMADPKGRGTLYEISPPYVTETAAWGYGLMQIDFEFNQNYISSGAWKDAASNILQGATKLAENYRNTQDITSAVSRYNGRGDAATLYAQKVLGSASSYGVA